MSFNITISNIMITIPKGTILYRSSIGIEDIKTSIDLQNNVRTCDDTGKTGLYFGSVMAFAIAMCVENNCKMNIGSFVLTQDIKVHYGKYSFRQLNPKRYFDKYGDLIPSVEPLNENVSHIDDNMYPMDHIDEAFLNPSMTNVLSRATHEHDLLHFSEVFITRRKLQHVQPINLYKINSYMFEYRLFKKYFASYTKVLRCRYDSLNDKKDFNKLFLSGTCFCTKQLIKSGVVFLCD